MDYMLRQSLTSSDIDFLNSTSIEFEIFDTHGLKPETNAFDSGWCDMDTGERIVSPRDRVRFKNVSEVDKTLLFLKFGDRLLSLTKRLEVIYTADNKSIDEIL